MQFLRGRQYFLSAFGPLFFLPAKVFADVGMSWSDEPSGLFLFPIIICAESIYFWFYTNRLLKCGIRLWMILLNILTANIVSTAVGSILAIEYVPKSDGAIIIYGYLPSVLLEWGIYNLFCVKVSIGTVDLLRISFVGNMITYTIIALVI